MIGRVFPSSASSRMKIMSLTTSVESSDDVHTMTENPSIHLAVARKQKEWLDWNASRNVTREEIEALYRSLKHVDAGHKFRDGMNEC